MNNVKIEYDGRYPNLCSGTLRVIIDEKEWVFPSHSLSTGGNVWFDDNWSEHVEDGPWSINHWPENFPEEYKSTVLYEVNNSIQHGCCGGCV